MKKVLTLRKKHGLLTVAEAKILVMDDAYQAADKDPVLAANLAGIGKTTMYRYLSSKNKSTAGRRQPTRRS